VAEGLSEAAGVWAQRLIASPAAIRLLLSQLPAAQREIDPPLGGWGAPQGLLAALDGLIEARRLALPHLQGEAEAARQELVEAVPLRHGADPEGELLGLWRALGAQDPPRRLRSAAVEGLPELWPPAPGGDDGPLPPELHAHTTGSVPFEALWRRWLTHPTEAVGLPLQLDLGGGHRVPVAQLLAALRAVGAGGDTCPELGPGTRPALTAAPAGAERLGWLLRLSAAAWARVSLLQARRRSGLVEFRGANDRRRRSQARMSASEQVAAALRRFARDRVEAVELRLAMPGEPRELGRRLHDAVTGYLRVLKETEGLPGPPPAFGVVVSLLKNLPGVPHRDRPTRWEGAVDALLHLLDESPLARRFVIGVDVAGAERGCPPRWFGPVRDRLRGWQAARGACGAVPRRWSPAALQRRLRDLGCPEALVEELDSQRMSVPGAPSAAWQRLGFTFHAGEDFDDPMTGLRQLWEALVELDLGPGDRIGHALVLGLDPPLLQELLRRRPEEPGRGPDAAATLDEDRLDPSADRGSPPRVPIFRKPRGEHLQDLAWEAERWGAASRPEEARGAELRLMGVGSRAWGTRDRAPLLAQLLRARDPREGWLLEGMGFDDPEALGPWHRELVPVEPDWCARFEELRQGVLSEVVRRGVVIESCPSSNLVVADLDTPPLAGLLRAQRSRHPGLQIAVATDDPGIFGRYPRDEWQLVRDLPPADPAASAAPPAGAGPHPVDHLKSATRAAAWIRPLESP
jgi:hypothetical protein